MVDAHLYVNNALNKIIKFGRREKQVSFRVYFWSDNGFTENDLDNNSLQGIVTMSQLKVRIRVFVLNYIATIILQYIAVYCYYMPGTCYIRRSIPDLHLL